MNEGDYKIYRYDEGNAYLCLSYDAFSGSILLLGGLHGFARMAELFQDYAAITVHGKSSYEDMHWYQLRPGEHGLTVIIDNRLGVQTRTSKVQPKGKSIPSHRDMYAYVEVSKEPTEFFTLLPGGDYKYERRESTVILKANAAGFQHLFELVDQVLTSATNKMNSKPIQVQGLSAGSCKLFLRFDSSLDQQL